MRIIKFFKLLKSGIIKFFRKFKYKYVGLLSHPIRHNYIDMNNKEQYYDTEITYMLLVNGFGKRKITASVEASYDKSYIDKTGTYRRAILPWLNGANIHKSWFAINGNTINENFVYDEDATDKEPKEPKEATILKHPHLTLIEGEKDKKNDGDTNDFEY